MNKQNRLLSLTSAGAILGIIAAIFIMPRLNNLSGYNFILYNSQDYNYPIISLISTCTLSGLLLGFLAYFCSEQFYARRLTIETHEIKNDIVINPKAEEFKEIFQETSLASEDILPPTPTDPAFQKGTFTVKAEYEETTSQHTFEDPEIGIKNPGEKLTETAATLFSKPAIDTPRKPELPDDSFPKKMLVKGL